MVENPIVKELDDLLIGKFTLNERQIPNIISNEGIYLLCAFCGSREIKYRITKYRFCEKDWKLFRLFSQLEIR